MPARTLQIDGASHAPVLPSSAIERLEIFGEVLNLCDRGGLSVARGAALLLWACYPSLRGGVRTAWAPGRGVKIGGEMADALMAQGLGSQDVEEIALSAGALDALKESLPPARKRVEDAVKNS